MKTPQPQRSEPCKREHHFEADGGPCLACGLTASQLIISILMRMVDQLAQDQRFQELAILHGNPRGKS